jgi:hypothetical protein
MTKHKGRKPILLCRTIDAMYQTGNTWETGKSLDDLSKLIYGDFKSDVALKMHIKTRQQIIYARKKLSQKLSDINFMGKEPFIPYYAGHAKIDLKDNLNIVEIGDKVASSFRYFWHTDIASLEELRQKFSKLEYAFSCVAKKSEEAKKIQSLGQDIKNSINAIKNENVAR